MEGKIWFVYDMLLCVSVVWMQLVSNAHITLTLLIYYSTILFFYFRYIDGWNEESYTGEYKQNMWNGKGEQEWADGSREIAYFVDGEAEGAAKFYDKNGNEEDRFYKDGELVEK